MIGTVTIEGGEGFRAALEAKITQVMGAFEGAEVAIVPAGARGQPKNTLIARVQQAMQRDPFYLDEQAKEAIRFALRGLMAAQYSVRKRALEITGEIMLLAIDRAFGAQRNPGGGSFRPLTPAYANAKRRKFGFVTPVLRASGDLLDNLRVRITKVR